MLCVSSRADRLHEAAVRREGVPVRRQRRVRVRDQRRQGARAVAEGRRRDLPVGQVRHHLGRPPTPPHHQPRRQSRRRRLRHPREGPPLGRPTLRRDAADVHARGSVREAAGGAPRQPRVHRGAVLLGAAAARDVAGRRATARREPADARR